MNTLTSITAKYKSDKIRRAHKEHVCSDCGSCILPEVEYMEQRHPIVRGGSPEYLPTDRWCAGCAGKRGLLATTADVREDIEFAIEDAGFDEAEVL